MTGFARVEKTKQVSILCLKCLFFIKDMNTEQKTQMGFNSLFEMQDGAKIRTLGMLDSFNSLFEMRGYDRGEVASEPAQFQFSV